METREDKKRCGRKVEANNVASSMLWIFIGHESILREQFGAKPTACRSCYWPCTHLLKDKRPSMFLLSNCVAYEMFFAKKCCTSRTMVLVCMPGTDVQCYTGLLHMKFNVWRWRCSEHRALKPTQLLPLPCLCNVHKFLRKAHYFENKTQRKRERQMNVE
jgi:hypothetical protein